MRFVSVAAAECGWGGFESEVFAAHFNVQYIKGQAYP